MSYDLGSIQQEDVLYERICFYFSIFKTVKWVYFCWVYFWFLEKCCPTLHVATTNQVLLTVGSVGPRKVAAPVLLFENLFLIEMILGKWNHCIFFVLESSTLRCREIIAYNSKSSNKGVWKNYYFLFTTSITILFRHLLECSKCLEWYRMYERICDETLAYWNDIW